MTLPMSFHVDNLGSAKLDLPIDAPPGTAGMMPHLSLSYSSSSGNGYVGVGWNLSGLPAITRCPWTIATNQSAEPVTFANGSTTTYDKYCFQGQPLVQAQQQSTAGEPNAQGLQFSQQLIQLTGSYYGADGATYSTEIEDFSRIVSHNPGGTAVGAASFTVYTRDGLIYEFGGTSDSQVLCTTAPACSGTTTVMTWMLDKVTDPVGNQITLSYIQNGSRAYPNQILYTANSGQGLGPTNALIFGYGTSRSDAPVQFFAGQQMQTNYLLGDIVTCVWINGTWTWVNAYTFAYGTGLTGRNRLASVTRYGVSNNTSEILGAQFGYCDSCGAPADLLSSFNNGLEGPTYIAYGLTTHSSIYAPNSSMPAYPTQNLVTPRYLVTEVAAPNGIGGSYRLYYTYSGGQQDLDGRGFLGFQGVYKADPQTGLNHATNYSTVFPFIGDATVDYTYLASNGPDYSLNYVATTLTTGTAYNGRSYPYISQTFNSQDDVYENPMPTVVKTFQQTDGYGNNTSITTTNTMQYKNSSGAYTANNVFTTTETDQYQNDSAGWSATNGDNWIIGRLTSHQVAASYTDNITPANNSGTTTRLTTYAVSGTTGLPSQEVVEPTVGTGFTLTSTFGYDVFGNKLSTSAVGDGVTRAASASYTATLDPGHEFPDSTTNALSQTASSTFEVRWGLPLTKTDIDGRVTTYTYDDLGRQTTETSSDGSKATTSYLFCSGVNSGSLTCPSGAQYAIETVHIGVDGSTQMSPTTIAYYDTLDRVLDTDTQSFNGSWSRVTKTYNTQLQLATQTRPYFVSGGTQEVTTYQYDQLNRITKTTFPDSSWQTIAYSQTNKSIAACCTTASPSPNGQSVWESYDQDGNLTQSIQSVTENGALNYIFTGYLYDGFNNLTKVTDTKGNVTKYTYDVLGRKTGITDPDAGTRTQSYSAFDDLTAIVDGKGTTASMTYDLLGRMLKRCWTNGMPQADMLTCPHPSATEVGETWAYDPAHGIGELSSSSSTQGTGASKTLTYNSASPTAGLLGTLSTASYTIAGVTFNKYKYAYDADNRPSSYVSQSTAQPTTIYNSYGYVSALRDGPSGTIVWQATSMDAENHLLSATFGNGVISGRNYDPATGRVVGVYSTAGQTSNFLQNIGYGWDQLGNMDSRDDATNGLIEEYGYDELNRLVSIKNHAGAVQNSFSYDVLGDMLTKGDVGTYSYPAAGSAQPHGVSSITAGGTTTSFAYDANGNLATETGGTTRSLAWTLFNQPSAITYAGKQIGFQYDADEQRSLQAAPEGTTYYLPDSELVPGDVWHTYFMVGGERVAEDYGPPGGPFQHHYFHNDYQNTIGLVTNDGYVFGQASGTAENEGSDAFGQPRSVTGASDPTWGANDVTKRRYINQEDLLDAHLIDLNARVYDPLIGKFLSPDPIIANQDDSQSWNAYAYSHNNPMSKEDPTGLEPDENPACQGDCGRGTPSGNNLGHGVYYDPRTNTLSVPVGTSSSVAQHIAGSIEGGGSQGSLAGAHDVGGIEQSMGSLSGTIHVGSAGAGHMFAGGPEEDELRPEGVMGDIRSAEYSSAARALRQIDPNNQALNTLTSDNFVPSEDAVVRMQDALQAAQAGVTARPSRVRQGTEQGNWDNAADGENGGKLCPTCGIEVRSLPRTTFKDWDNDHVPAWRSRDLTGLDRKGVLDNYNTGTQLRCVSCNRSDNGSGN